MPAMTNATILRWAARPCATTPRQLADLTRKSPPVVLTWRDTPRAAANPRILLIVAAVEAGVEPTAISTPEQIAAAWLNASLPSLSALDAQLGVSRQTLHSWGRTSRVPAWVPLACAGLTAMPGCPSLT